MSRHAAEGLIRVQFGRISSLDSQFREWLNSFAKPQVAPLVAPGFLPGFVTGGLKGVILAESCARGFLKPQRRKELGVPPGSRRPSIY